MTDLFGGWAYEDKYRVYESPEGYCPKCGLDGITYGDPLSPLDGILPHGQMIIERQVWADDWIQSAFGQVERNKIIKRYVFDEVMEYRHCDTCGHHWCYLMHKHPEK